MKKIIQLVLLTLCLFANSQNNNQGIIGLSSLIQLGVEPTTFDLEDYFLDTTKLNIIKYPEGLSLKTNKNLVTLKGKMNHPVDVILIEQNNKTFAIPIRNTIREEYNFSFKADKTYTNLRIKGSFNDWNLDKNKLEFKDGTYSFSTYLNPGRYEYVFVEGEKEFPDPSNPNKKPNGVGGINSIFEVGNLKKEKLFITPSSFNKEIITIQAGGNLNYLVLLDNQILDKKYLSIQGNNLNITLPKELKKSLRNHLRVYGFNTKEFSNDVLIPLSKGQPILNSEELNRKDKHKMSIYSLMVDRFYDAKKTNNFPINSKEVLPLNDYLGGDLMGITSKIKENYFSDLGTNTIWISPIVQNPLGTYGLFEEETTIDGKKVKVPNGIKSTFTGYHGYWPTSSSKIDFRFGTDKEFTRLINSAHKKEMNILLDYVANHVHQEHPLLKKHPNWITSRTTADGRDNIKLWDEYRLTTWFDPFIPSLDLENQEVTNVMTDSAVYWVKKFPLDGFRHDATKHIPNNFWKTLTKKVKKEIIIGENRSIYQIGETYGGHDLIGSYINNGMLDAQFDFSVFESLRSTLAKPDVPMTNLAIALNESLHYYGYHNLMGNISGNHDKERTISFMDGSFAEGEDPKLAGYKNKIENKNAKGFDKLAQMFAFNAFIPGIPVVYYGDEIGMPGGNDPDCRRMMIFNQLNENQLKLKNTVKELLSLRNNNLALIYGDTKVIHSDEKSITILRTYFNNKALLILNKSNTAKQIDEDLIKTNFTNSYKVLNPKKSNSTKIDSNSFVIIYQ
jgi:cyclomaltodextrinase